MKNNFFSASLGNINSKPSPNSEILSQILYGEKFTILSKTKNWVKIKTNYDNYIGYIKKKKFYQKFKPERKIHKLRSKIFVKKNNKFFSSNKYLYFGSGIPILNKNKDFIEFDKNKWVRKKETKIISHKEKNFIKVLKIFLNCKYLWGGKSCDGIDCSALIQIYFYYNRIFFPRDSKDQIKFCKKKIKKKLDRGDIIFWKGHVGICLNKSKFIHAYGPKKKVIIMSTKFTINLIYKTANLVIKKISNIKNY
tara:strand:- start:312 stop:1064 length:753 start_codon:yes stop_codon:yes gene_type:complete